MTVNEAIGMKKYKISQIELSCLQKSRSYKQSRVSQNIIADQVYLKNI